MEVWLEISYDKVQITSLKSVNPLMPGGNKGNSFLKVIHHEKVGGGGVTLTLLVIFPKMYLLKRG